MSDISRTTTNALQEAGDAATQAARNASESVKSAVNSITEQAKDTAADVSQTITTTSAHFDKQASSTLGGGLRAAGEAVRQNAPNQGRNGKASARVAQTLTDGGDYLEREGLEGVLQNVANMIRSNPIPAFCIGVGLGFLLLRPLSKRT